jgi:glycosyltransferase involved in cell wall biosynthesis
MLLDNPCAPDPRVQREAAALVAAEADVDILCWDRDGKTPATEDQGGVRLERLVTKSGRQLGARQLRNLWRFYRMAWSRLRGRPIDVVHAHDLLMLPLGAAIARRAGAALVYDAHEIYHVMEAHRYSRWLRGAMALTEKYLIRVFVDAFITVSQQRIDAYWKAIVSAERTTVVANWYDPADRDESVRRAVRAEQGILDDTMWVTYVGGFTGERRMDVLVEAARRTPHVFYLVAGRGIPEVEAMLSAAALELPNFRYIGWAANPQRIFAASDALYYVLDPGHPYSGYAASNTLYTAIANRLPLITCDVGEPGEVMRKIERRLVMPAPTADALVAAVTWLADRTARDRISCEMGSWRSRFTWAASRNNLISAYSRLTAGRPAPPRAAVIAGTSAQSVSFARG